MEEKIQRQLGRMEGSANAEKNFTIADGKEDNNGLYETLVLKDNTIDYFKPTSTNNTNSLDNCTRYTFNKHNNTLILKSMNSS